MGVPILVPDLGSGGVVVADSRAGGGPLLVDVGCGPHERVAQREKTRDAMLRPFRVTE